MATTTHQFIMSTSKIKAKLRTSVEDDRGPFLSPAECAILVEALDLLAAAYPVRES